MTKLIHIVSGIAAKLEVQAELGPDIEELKTGIVPEAVLDEIEAVS